jgi:hypothetical protein
MSTEKSHLLCFYICGFNIAIIAGVFTLAFSRLLGRRWGAQTAGLPGAGMHLAAEGYARTAFDLGDGAVLRVLTASLHGATLLLE